MKYTEIFTNGEGETHFKDVEIELESDQYAPPAPPFMVSELRPATHYGFSQFPSGWVGEWHPAPRRQFYLMLSGEVECTVSDGERRVFGPGSIVLLEDTTGKGHVTRVVGSKDVVTAMVVLDD
jgi:hypothetical protein